MSERIFNHTAHKAMWYWLSKNPKKNKHDWPGWRYNGGDLDGGINECFACEYAVCDGRIDCARCPLTQWTDLSKERKYFSYVESDECRGDAEGLCMIGLYGKWCDAYYARDLEKIAFFAKKIRDLPVKKHVVCR